MNKFFTVVVVILFFSNQVFSTNSIDEVQKGFIENKGQMEDHVLYYALLNNQNIIITKDGFSYDNYSQNKDVSEHHRIDITYQNKQKSLHIKKEGALGYKSNFYLNGKEFVNIQSYNSITVSNVYPGIDIKYYVDVLTGVFKFDYILNVGSNINNIQFKVAGAEAMLVNNELNINTKLGLLIEKIPYSYIAETKKEVAVKYISLGSQIFGFECEHTINNQTLVIDPTPNIKWATYHGGSSDDAYWDLDFDTAFNSYHIGRTNSTNNLSTSGAYQTSKSSNYDVYLSKFDKTGKLIWCTYYGSTGSDEGITIAVDKVGDIIVAGYTTSSSGLSTSGAHQTSNAGLEDVFIAKFSSTGSRIWSTFYGGSGNDETFEVVVDSKNNYYFVGKTGSSSGIGTSGTYQSSYTSGEDAFLSKFSTNGSLIWGTYMGGSSQDYITGLTIDKKDNLYFAGFTYSSSKVAYNAKYQSSLGGAGDAFFGKINANGNMDWINYFGGSGLDIGFKIAINNYYDIFIVGSTASTSNISTSGANQTSYSGNTDGFLASFDTLGNRNWSTYIGGTNYDEVYNVLCRNDKTFLVGKSSSTTNISTSQAYQVSNAGGLDSYVQKYNKNGVRAWGSYFGGTSDDMARGIGFSENLLMFSGLTGSNSNISTSGSHQSSLGGSTDGFIATFENLGCEIQSELLTTPKCAGDSTGSAFVSLPDGVGTINYYWKTTPPQYSDTARNLPKGTYEVVVSDAVGCKDSIKVTITEPGKLVAFVKDSIHISCAGRKDGKLIAGYSGGTAPYAFLWKTTPVQNKDTATGLAKGTYWLKITDKNGCNDSASATIIEPDTLTSKITGFRNASCFLLNDGLISVTAYGGTLPYSYAWSTSPVQTTSSAYNITAGYYEVVIKDKMGCTTKNNYTITEPSPVTIGLTNIENCICYNDSNGQIFTKVWGGTPGYKIAWNTTPISTDLNLTKLKGGNYRLTITDTLNCVATRNFTIVEPPPIVLKFDSITDVLCKNGNNGSVYLQIAGGSPKYSIFWHTAPTSNQNKLMNLKAGAYAVTVKDSMSCQIIDSVKINEPDSLIINGQVTQVQCNGNNSGEIKTTVSGGKAPFTFIWAHDSTINKPNVSKLTAGNYLLEVRDINKCMSNKQFIITEPSKIEIRQQLVKPIACYNGADGRLSVSMNGGTPPLKLIWNTTPQRFTLSIDSIKAGYYTATVVDSFGCSDSLSIQITEPKQLVGYFDSVASPTCYKKLDGSSTYKVVGGTKPYVYSFDNAPFQNDSLVYKIGAGFVKVKIIDAKGCVLLDSNQLFHPSELKSEASLEHISCFGLSDGRIILGTSGGVKPYKYQWSNGANDSATAFGLNKGYYYLTILDKNNCSIKDTFSITEPDKLLAQIDITLPATCYNGSDGLASGKATGGTKPYDYFWTGLSNQNSQIAKNLRAGAYKLYVKDAHGCLDSAFTQVGRPNKVQARISASKRPTCEFGSDGEATVLAIPGVEPYTYLWSNGSNLSTIQGLKKGVYSVIITDACGDTAMAQVQIDDPAPFIIPNITGYIISKKGTIENYQLADIQGWAYSWEVENGEIVSGNGTHSVNIKWANAEKGTIKVTVTNALGCTDDNFLMVRLFDECMLVFPNPSSTETTVFLPFYNQDKSLELFDAKGSKVFTTPAQKVNKVDVSYLARGVYIFRYESCKIKFLKD